MRTSYPARFAFRQMDFHEKNQKRKKAPIIGSAVCVKAPVEVKSLVRSGAL